MRQKFQWEVSKSKHDAHDELLSCLELLTKYYKTPCSKQMLTANLPLVEDKLTLDLFPIASKRAKLESQAHKISLEEINAATLPVILILKNNKVALLVEKNEGFGRILLMETGSGLNSIKLEDLTKQYSGTAIFVKPIYQFSSRSQSIFESKGKNWFWSVFIKAWPIYSEVLLASFMINMFALAIPLFVMNVYDRVVPNAAFETLWVLALGVFLVILFDFILKSMRGYFIDSASKRVDVRVSSAIFYQILGMKMENRPQSVGGFVNIVQSFEVFRDFITSSTVTVLVDLPFVFLFIFIIYLIGGSLFIIPLAVLPIAIIVGLIIQLPLINLTRQSYQCGAEKQATLVEAIQGAEALKCTRAEGSMQQRWEQVVLNSAKIGNKLRYFSNIGVSITQVCQQLVVVSIVVLGVYKINEGELTIGALIACTILSGRAIAPMAQVASLITRYFHAMNSLRVIDNIMNMPTETNFAKKYLHRPNIEPSIQFKGVKFKYPNADKSVFNDLSFSIQAGEKVAIMGTLGSGKSTIAKLIMGLYAPEEGTILLGDVDQQQINPADLRHQIGYMPQDIYLFFGSVKENITLGASYVDDTTILRAAHIAGVDRFVKKTPQGFDLQVGEGGRFLSGGQRQAVALSRALLLTPNILILDEPCSSMDIASEKLVCDALKSNIPKETTLILATHSISMLQLVDRIIVLDAGNVMLDGPKEQILEQIKKLKKAKKEQQQ